MSDRWQVQDTSAHVLFRAWADGAIAYQIVSGETHLLDSISALVLLRLQEGSAPFSDLIRLAGPLALPAGVTQSELSAWLETVVLPALHGLGLIEPVDR